MIITTRGFSKLRLWIRTLGSCRNGDWRKESDKRWEEGEDLSLLEFKAIQYRRKGNAVADEGQLVRIARIPKREFMRRGINQHTLEKICEQEPVRVNKLAECLKVLEEYEASKGQSTGQ